MAKFLVVLDADSTLIEDEVIDLLADAAGSHGEVVAITESAMNGDMDFAESLRLRVATLKGLPESALNDVRARVRLTKGAHELVTGVHAAGGRVAVVSGGFHEVIDPLAAGLGLDRWRANCLDIAQGVLSGTTSGRVIDAKAKEAALREWAAIYSVPLERTIAVGDGANDLEMLATSGLAVAFDAKPSVRDAADVIMNDRDLTQVLPLLGLRG